LARDIALIMGGFEAACMGPSTMNIPEHKEKYKGMLWQSRVPRVADAFGRTMNNVFLTAVGACVIDNNDNLYPIDNDLFHHIEAMIEAIGGRENAARYKFTCPDTKKTFDLNSLYGWNAMFRSIHICEQGRLDVAHLPEDLQAHLERIHITGIYFALQGKTQTTLYGPASLETSIDALQTSHALKSVFKTDELAQIADFYRKRIPQRLEQMAAILLEETIVGLETDKKHTKEGEMKGRLAHRFNSTVNAVIKEEENASKVAHQFTRRPDTQDSLEAIKARPNSMKLLRPHFRKAVEERMDQMRKSGTADNFILAGLADSADFLERESLDIRHMHQHELIMSSAVLSMLINRLPDRKILARYNSNVWFKKLEAATMLALSEPQYTREDVIQMLRDCKAQTDKQLEEVTKQSKERETYSILFRVGRPEMRRAYRHVIRGIKSIQQSGGYDALIAKIEALPLTGPQTTQIKTGAKKAPAVV